jgi:hypothetical protein
VKAGRTIFNTYLLIITNLILAFFLVGVLGGDFMPYRTAFYVAAPFVLGLAVYISYYLYLQTKRLLRKYLTPLNYSWTLVFVLFNAVLLFFNCWLWLDLFDGTTEMMLP